jgi:hypothetical protein
VSKLTNDSVGARFYMLKMILHDWPKPQAVEILRKIVPAMKHGYSKVFIVENVLPDGRLPLALVGLDMIMMVAYASLERTEPQWRDVLGEAGLRITNIWTHGSGDSVIEAERVSE